MHSPFGCSQELGLHTNQAPPIVVACGDAKWQPGQQPERLSVLLRRRM
jgi:hypothetical protein